MSDYESSRTVEERVVEMRIDNSKFESGANKTIGILEKLEKALHLHADTDELDKLSDAMGNFDVSPMANGLDSLQSHFSALEIAGMRVISNLTDSIYNFTEKTVKSFTIEPVMQGWEKFGDKTTAVATLKAQGYELEKVNKLMDDLNWFTDETSYNFTDMVSNIAKFTATGQDLDESVTAMEGIALWAALSGQNATKASMAMYQLSQAMGKGALRYDDFKSIQNASMDTQEFRMQAVKAAEAVGKLKQVGEDTWVVIGGSGSKDEEKLTKLTRKLRDAEIDLQYALDKQASATTASTLESANKSVEKLQYKIADLQEDIAVLSDVGASGAHTLAELFSSDVLTRQQWMSSDVMMETFNSYSKAVKAIQQYMEDNDIDTASDAIKAMRLEVENLAHELGVTLDEAFEIFNYDIDQFSLKAFEAGQNARTWKDVVDSVKDAVSTKWMTTFELLFGDADKATSFWTKLANDFWTIFASGGDTRNSILRTAMGTGDSIKEAVDYMEKKFGSSFSPKTGQAVEDLGIDQLSEDLGEAQTNVEEFANTSAWEKLEYEVNQNGRTMDDFQEALSDIMAESKAVELNALIEKYGSLEEALKSGEIEAGEFYEALQKLRSGDGSTAADEIEESAVAAKHSLEDLKQVAWGVLRGDYGNGEDRRKALEALGYNYDLVQGIAEIMWNGGQGYVGVTEELLRNEYPTFYAMMQEQLALNEEYADSWDSIVNSEEDAAALLDEFQNSVEDVAEGSYSPKTNGTVSALERAVEPYLLMLEDFETELNEAYQQYIDLEDEIARDGMTVERQRALEEVNDKIEDIASNIEKVNQKIQLLEKLDMLGYIDADGYEQFIGILGRISDIFVRIKEVADEAKENVFGDAVIRGLKLKATLGQVSDFVQSITMSEEAIDGVRSIFEAFYNVVRIGGRVLGIAIKLFSSLSMIAVRFVDKVLGLFGLTNINYIFGKIDSALDFIESIVDIFTGFLNDAINGELANSFFEFLAGVIESIAEWTETAKYYVGELVSFLEPALGLIITAAAGITGWAFTTALSLIVGVCNHITNAYNVIKNWAQESSILQTIWSKITTSFLAITSAIAYGWNYIKNAIANNSFTKGMESFWEWLKAIGKVQFPKISAFFTTISESVSSIGETLKSKLSFSSLTASFDSIVSIFGAGITGLGGLISLVFGGFLSLVTGIVKGLQGVNFDTSKITDSFTKFSDVVMFLFTGFFGNADEVKERVKAFMTEIWNGFVEALEQFSLRDMIKALRMSLIFAFGVRIHQVLSSIKKIGDEGSTILESISWTIKRGGRLLDSIGESFRSDAIIKMAIAVGMVATALYFLTKIDKDKLTHAAAVITVVMAILSMLVNHIRKDKLSNNIHIKQFSLFGSLGGALVGLGVALAVFVNAIFKIASIENPTRLVIAATAVLVFIGLVTLIIGLFASKLAKSDANWERLKNIGIIVKRLGSAFVSIAIAVGLLLLPVLLLVAAGALLEKNHLDPNHLWNAVIGIGILILAIGGVVAMIIATMSKLSDGQVDAAGRALLKMGASILLLAIGFQMLMTPFYILAAACTVLTVLGFSTSGMFDGMWIFLAIFGALAVFFLLMGRIMNRKHMDADRLKAFGRSLLEMGGSIALVGIGIKKMVNAFLGIIIVLSVLKKLNMEVDFAGAAGTLAALAVAILVIAGILAKISTMKGLSEKKLLAIAGVIVSVGIAILFITPAIIGLGAVIAILAYFTSALTDFEKVAKNMKSIAWVLLGVAVAALAFGVAIGFVGKGVFYAALAFGILAASIYLIVRALDMFSVHQDAIIELIKKLKGYFTMDNALVIVKFAAGFLVLIGVIGALAKAAKWIYRFFNLFANGINITDKFKTNLGTFGKNLPKMLANSFHKVTQYMMKHADDIIPALGLIITIIGGYLTGVIPTLSTQLVSALVALLESLAKEIKSNKNKIMNSLSDIATTIIDILGGVLKKAFGLKAWSNGGFWENIVRGLFEGTGIFKLLTIFLNLLVPISKLWREIKTGGNGTIAVKLVSQVAGGATAGVTAGETTGVVINSKSVGEVVGTVVGDTVGEAISGASKSLLQYIIPIAAILGVIAFTAYAIKRSIDFQEDREDKAKYEADKALTKEARQTMLVDTMNKRNQSDLHFANPTQLSKEQRKQLAKDLQDKETEKELLRRLAQDAGGFIDEYTIDKLAKKYKNNGWADDEQVLVDLQKLVTEDTEDNLFFLQSVFDYTDEEAEYLKEHLAEFIKYAGTGSNYDDFAIFYSEALPIEANIGHLIKLMKEQNLPIEAAVSLINIFSNDLENDIPLISQYYNEIKAAGIDLERVKNIHSQYEIPWSTIKETMQQTGMSLSDTVALAEYLGNEFNSDITDATGQYLLAIKEAGISAERIRNLQNKGISFLDVFTRSGQSGIGLSDTMTLLETMGKSQYDSVNDVAELQRMLDDIKAFQAKQAEELKATSNDFLAEYKKLMDASPISADIKELTTGLFNDIQNNEELRSQFTEALKSHGLGESIPEAITTALVDPSKKEEVAFALGDFLKDAAQNDQLSESVKTALESSGLGDDFATASKEIISAKLQEYNVAALFGEKFSEYLSGDASIGELGGQFFTTMLGGSSAQDGLGNAIQAVFSSVMSDTGLQTYLTDQGYDIGTWLGLGTKDGVIGSTDVAADGVRSLASALVNALIAPESEGGLDVNSPSKVFTRLAGCIPEGVRDGVNQNTSVAINAVIALARNMQVPFHNIQSIFQNFGVQAVRGVVIGINNNVNAAYNAGVNLANAVNRGYSETLKIKSPSRVFMKLSSYIPEGAAIGIMQGIPVAVAAVSDLSKALMDEAAYALSDMAYVASDLYDFQPSISPVFDMNSMMAARDQLNQFLSDNATNLRARADFSQALPQNGITYTIQTQNRDVVTELRYLIDRVGQLGEAIEHMQLVLDTGALVGQITPSVNQQLGALTRRERRQ